MCKESGETKDLLLLAVCPGAPHCEVKGQVKGLECRHMRTLAQLQGNVILLSNSVIVAR